MEESSLLNINGKTLADILSLKENQHPDLSDLSKATQSMSGKTGPEAKGPDFNKALLVILKISFLMVKTVLRIP